MQFNDVTLGSGIIQDIDDWVNTDDTSYPIAKKTKDINAWLDRVVSLILLADGRWQWDDSNYTDLPIGTGTLVDGQQDYNISGSTFLQILRVEIMDSNGNYNLLTPIDEHDITRQAMSEYHKTAGLPTQYDKKGDSIFLYPAPSSSAVTLAKGLKVSFQRAGSHFVVGDTTKEPGFNPLFHRILSFGPALDYASKNEMINKIKIIQARLDRMEAGLIEAYTVRSKDEQIRIRLRKENYGGDGFGGRLGDKQI